MKVPNLILLTTFGLITAGAIVAIASDKGAKPVKGETIMEVLPELPAQPESPVVRTEKEWKEVLTAEQYRILRKDGTERANGPVYKEFKNHEGGTYVCAGCDTVLFHSDTQFDSKSGWPSFYDPAKAENVKLDTDYHLGYARTEVRCANCEGHLGHVFSGEGFGTPTDKRYCINGTVLKYVPEPSEDS